MVDRIQAAKLQKTSKSTVSVSGSGGAVNRQQLAALQKQAAQMRSGGDISGISQAAKAQAQGTVNKDNSRSGGGASGQIAQIKNEIAMLYKQVEEGLKNSPGPNAVSQSPWTEGPRANQATGQIEQAMAQIRVKQEKIKALEQAEKSGNLNDPAFNDLMKTYSQMEDMAKLQDFNPGYDGFNSIKMTTNSYVGDQMFKLRNLAELHKAEMANNS